MNTTQVLNKIYFQKRQKAIANAKIKAVAKAKKEWLAKYNFPADEIHCVKYGTTKANCTRKKADFQILIDDNKKVRDGWTLGTTVNAQFDIMKFLKALG